MFPDIRTDDSTCDHLAHGHEFYHAGNDVMFCSFCNEPRAFYYSSCPWCAGEIVRDGDRVACSTARCEYEREIPTGTDEYATERREKTLAQWLNARYIKPVSWVNHLDAEGGDHNWIEPDYQTERRAPARL